MNEGAYLSMPGFSPGARTFLGEQLNTLGPGSYFGERALLRSEPRAASVVAVSAGTRCVSIRRDPFFAAIAAAAGGEWSPEALVADGAWGYATRQAPPPSRAAAETRSSLSTRLSTIPLMQRLRLVRAAVRAFEQAGSRAPAYGDPAERAYRAALVAQLTRAQRSEFETAFAMLDKDASGVIDIANLRSLMASVGRRMSDSELADMINKADPEVDGNTGLALPAFLALMAQAEFSGLFLDAFSLLDTEDNGWVEATALWTMMDELVDPVSSSGAASGVFSAEKLRAIKRRFDVGDDGHINYGSFVRLMLDEDSEDYKPEYV